MTADSREQVSTPARWRSLLDHRRGEGNHGRLAVPLPVAAPYNPMPTRSRQKVSTPARWRSLLDHRKAPSYLSLLLRLSTR
jgi:hypothetical protein